MDHSLPKGIIYVQYMLQRLCREYPVLCRCKYPLMQA